MGRASGFDRAGRRVGFKEQVALSVAWIDIGSGGRRGARRWLHLVALVLLVLGCLAKGMIVAKAAYLQGMASERAMALSQPAGVSASDPGDKHPKGSPALCVSAGHLAPLAACPIPSATLRETALIHILPLYPVLSGREGQPPDRPPRLPA